jgi:hypothetical protein
MTPGECGSRGYRNLTNKLYNRPAQSKTSKCASLGRIDTRLPRRQILIPDCQKNDILALVAQPCRLHLDAPGAGARPATRSTSGENRTFVFSSKPD